MNKHNDINGSDDNINNINNIENIEKLKNAVNCAKHVVFFGGAGVSTESGIPDFRSTGGLYNQKNADFGYPPETILSHTFFVNNTAEFYRFYFDKMIYTNAQPNAAHKKLAELEKNGKLAAVITQNIDGLHQAAGSKNVFELHGSVHRNYCEKCGKFYSLEDILKFAPDVPHCSCGGVIKPDVVLYEEPLNDKILSGAIREIENSDLLIIGGTSLNVYPAAGLITYAKGKIALVNKTPTPYDRYAEIAVNRPIGEVFQKL